MRKPSALGVDAGAGLAESIGSDVIRLMAPALNPNPAPNPDFHSDLDYEQD
jgi:hypothetical protein